MALNRLTCSSFPRTFHLNTCRLLSTGAVKVAPTPPQLNLDDPSAPKYEKISKAMQVYMEKAQERAAFLKEKREEFELGKRHLANIMGWNPDTISQDDIDEAIRYLLPTMLFAKTARPMMKPPEEIYPKQRGALFEPNGRPFHFLFYTGKAKYFEHLRELFSSYMYISDIDAKAKAKGIFDNGPQDFYNLTGTTWLTFKEYQSLTLESIAEEDYDYMIKALERLVKHPYSVQVKDFIAKFRKELSLAASAENIPPAIVAEDGRTYAEAEGE